MKIAGEITEYEESVLEQLILEKDPSVRETLRRYSLYNLFTFIHLVAKVSHSFNFYMQKMVAPIFSQRRMKNMLLIFHSMSLKSLSSSSSSNNNNNNNSVHPFSSYMLPSMMKMALLLYPPSLPKMHCTMLSVIDRS